MSPAASAAARAAAGCRCRPRWGTLVVIADYAGQRILEPTQLPAGLLTVVIGGPYFMVVLLRASRTGLPA